MRTFEQILQEQRVTLADLVKAAILNRDHMPTSSAIAAQHVAEVLSDDAGEVAELKRRILAAMPIDAGSET